MLYAGLVLVPLSGWVHHAAAPGFAPLALPFALSLPLVPVSAGVADTAAAVHLLASRVLVALALLHVVAALKHTWVDGDTTLRRMLSGSKSETAPNRKGTGALALMLAFGLWAGALWLAHARGFLSTPSIATEVSFLPEPKSDWIVEEGTLDLAITQFGERVEGRFENWTAAISFEDRPEPGPLGGIDVIISTGSLRLGSVSAQAAGPDFLDTSVFPNARYTATLMRAADGYVARGRLRLRGVEQDLDLPFQLSMTDGLAEVQGRVILDRRRFDIGQNMTNADQLGFEVEILVNLTARRPEP
jgi:polyisoprenoid-binding protein YceI